MAGLIRQIVACCKGNAVEEDEVEYLRRSYGIEESDFSSSSWDSNDSSVGLPAPPQQHGVQQLPAAASIVSPTKLTHSLMQDQRSSVEN
jgi:hypothetical protein